MGFCACGRCSDLGHLESQKLQTDNKEGDTTDIVAERLQGLSTEFSFVPG